MSNENPNSNNEDEISLYEIYTILRKRGLSIIIITITFSALAGIYGFIRPTDYNYQACATMGISGYDQNGQPIFIDSPKSAIAQLENAYIPSTIDNFLKGQKKIEFDTKQFETFNPKGSPIVCIKTKAPSRLGAKVSQIQDASLNLLVKDNDRITAVPKASAKANIKQLESTAQILSTKIANVQDQENSVNSELALLKTKDAVLQNQGSQIAQEIQRMLPLVENGSHDVRSNASALTMMIQNNQTAQEQNQLFKIEMDRSISLPKEKIKLLNQLKSLNREKNDINSQLATNAAKLELANASLKALRATHIVRPSSPSIEPVGLGKGVLIALGAFAGLILGVFYALLANALSSDKINRSAA